MRLPLIAPADLTAEQRPVYEDMKAGIEKNFQGFKTIAQNGALLGPWNPWLHDPKFGKPIWDLTLALSISPSLPRPVREVAILVTGATFHSSYELYAHVIAGERRGLSDEKKLATIVSGQRPSDLTPRRRRSPTTSPLPCCIYGTLPELSYRVGRQGVRAAWRGGIDLSRGTVLSRFRDVNGFNVPVPEGEAE